ncbi:sensor histidine kinase [Rugosimonospora africana]|uniref:Sensor-like histidine kinase SenX3 n=1 Tax=Rugosimonospora africana TaxID=556532 RepID=A0A8J3R432_9ACTN|nr:HAMP domain-containing sensor histidine kinase [Rugosimonospora africana]GIH21517.1 two-component sensor histidine kinase [Rugosimonospora africana]
MRQRGPAAADQELISRVWRRITLQTAAMFAAALLLLGALAVGLVLQTGRADARRQVAQAVADQDALTKPPQGVWIYQRTSGGLRSSPGAPTTPTDAATLNSVFSGGRTRTSTIHRSGREYEVQTQRVGAAAVQAVLDISDAERERHRLYWGLAAAGTVGLGLAALVGAVIARRAIVPLGLAFERQQRFVADASHELRTPLTQLHTRAQLLDRELRMGGDPVRLEEDVRQIILGTRHLGDVVEELLLAAQLRAEPATFGPVDLAELVNDAVAAERARSTQLSVELRAVVPTDGAYVVRGADTALRRVLTSLIDNALGHTPAGGHITIRLGHEPARGVVTCRVQDDGAGFDPTTAQRMFERFARGGHGDRRRFGLGLALVRETVQAHGGTVDATGAPGAGATFTVTLPVWTTAGTDGPAGREPHHSTSEEKGASRGLPATRSADS